MEPLPLNEAAQFFKNKRSAFEIQKYYMIFGGIPKYLEQIDPMLSLPKNMDHLAFQRGGFFINEFETIFKEQFKVSKKYEAIVNALARRSLAKEELSRVVKMSSGGGQSQYLEHLEQAGFVRSFAAFDFEKGQKSKTRKYVLWDEWIRFYFYYVKSNLHLISENTKAGLFERLTERSLDSYFGLAFERLCYKNFPLLLKALDLRLDEVVNFGPYFKQGSRAGGKSRKNKAAASGVQIDLLIERRGHTLMLVECKFSSNPISVDVIKEVETKIKFLGAPRRYSIEKVLLVGGDVTPELEGKKYFNKIISMSSII